MIGNETLILVKARREVDRVIAHLRGCLEVEDPPEHILRRPNLRASIMTWERFREILNGEING